MVALVEVVAQHPLAFIGTAGFLIVITALLGSLLVAVIRAAKGTDVEGGQDETDL